jgi:iron-sulfur cluster insertion protein
MWHMSTIIPDITITAKAAQKVYTLLAEDGDFDLMLRVYIEGGGCSGLQYRFTFDPQKRPYDQTMKVSVPMLHAEDETLFSAETLGLNADAEIPKDSHIQVAIDHLSYPLLKGATIDYVIDASGEYFAVRNPHASGQCGCGSSFSV